MGSVYVDDLTVRTAVELWMGSFLTDAEADQEIRAACQKAPVSAGQDAASALEALGVTPQGVKKIRGKHDETVSDHNHPTRVFGVPPNGVLGSLWVHAGLGVLAGKPCAGQRVLAGTGAKRKTCAVRRTLAGNQFRFPRVVRHVFTSWAVWCESFVGLGFRSSPVGFSSLLFHDFHDMSTVFDMDFDRFVFCSFGSGGSSSVQRSKLDLRVSPCCPAGCKKAADMGGGKGKGRKDYRHDVGEMAHVMTGAYRHGRHRHCGYIDSAGWVNVSDSAWLFYVDESWTLSAAD